MGLTFPELIFLFHLNIIKTILFSTIIHGDYGALWWHIERQCGTLRVAHMDPEPAALTHRKLLLERYCAVMDHWEIKSE